MRDHGGDLDRAKVLYGGQDWIDLSTGINRVPYPVGPIPPEAWTALPLSSALHDLEQQAAQTYRTQAEVTALPGAQAAIQLVPRLSAPGRAAVLWPSYNEHSAALVAQGWQVHQAPDLQAMEGADLAVVVNPNNPDGRFWPPATLAALAPKVGRLIVDESFADPVPALSLAPYLHDLGENVIVLRSFGKFYGLAGLRLGFTLSGPQTAAQLRAHAGPWAVSGPALDIGQQALADTDWQSTTTARLHTDSARLCAIADDLGWPIVGQTALFVTLNTPDAAQVQTHLARAQIWSRIFPYSPTWLRLGLPGSEAEWARLEAALRTYRAT
ncbi:MAG: threonine-phosphate decarboxylase CobD [Roseinatronobacter sp.]